MTVRSLSATRVALVPRPELHSAGKLCLVLLGVLTVGALGGATFLILEPGGSLMQWDVSMLAASPFGDFLIPGLILGGLFGLGSIAVVVLGVQHSRVAPFLAFAIGGAQMIWIVVKLAIIGEFSFLHPTMLGIGLGIALTAVRWGWPTFQACRASPKHPPADSSRCSPPPGCTSDGPPCTPVSGLGAPMIRSESWQLDYGEAMAEIDVTRSTRSVVATIRSGYRCRRLSRGDVHCHAHACSPPHVSRLRSPFRSCRPPPRRRVSWPTT